MSDKKQNSVTVRSRRQRQATIAAMAVMALMVASPAHAQLFGTADNFAQNVLDFLNNGFVRVVAIIAVIFVGLGWLFNKIEARRAMAVGAGIILIFAAAAIVDGIAGAV